MCRVQNFSLLIVTVALVCACSTNDVTDRPGHQLSKTDTVTTKTANTGTKPSPSQEGATVKITRAAPRKEKQEKAIQGKADAGPRGNIESGASLYLTYCSACHQKDGRGMGGALAADFVNDTSRLAKPDSVLLKSISDGVKGKLVMPPQKTILNQQQQRDVLAYIRFTFSSNFLPSKS